MGNLIGTDATGTVPLYGQSGIFIGFGSTYNTIGGTALVDRNVISGNSGPGIQFNLTGTSFNVVAGNFIGTDITGTIAVPNGNVGIAINQGASSNTIGGTVLGAANVISGNNAGGVVITGLGTEANAVIGNLIGTDVSGTQSVGDIGFGVDIDGDASSNTIGGSASGDGNLIAGNEGDGVEINGALANYVQGNVIGQDYGGPDEIYNSNIGVYITGTSVTHALTGQNVIGGTSAGAGNVITGNSMGIYITGGFLDLVAGNLIGTNALGTQAEQNTGDGIFSENGIGITIGGTATGAGNVIAGNDGDGIDLFGDTGDVIAGNKIGTDITGTVGLGNEADGIVISSYSENITVGGTIPGSGNVISDNDGPGVYIVQSSNNLVAGNQIGTDITGTVALANAGAGISILDDSDYNTIGGPSSFAGNLISGNSGDGIDISGSSYNVVEQNFIGTDITGTLSLGNGGDGVDIFHGAQYNTIGGTVAGNRAQRAGNLISGNAGVGVAISDPTMGPTSFNLVIANFIGTDVTGDVPVPNLQGGVSISSEAALNTIGGTIPAAANLISGNAKFGVLIDEGLANVVLGNLIGLNSAGTAALGNIGSGVQVDGSSALYNMGKTGSNVIGGITAGAGNVISGNLASGIFISGGHLDVVAGNLVGTNAAGTVALGNQGPGIQISQGSGNTIGGAGLGAGNLISGNAGDGINISGSSGDLIAGNKIGTDATGTVAVGNRGDGIDLIDDDTQTTIGGTTAVRAM